MKRLVSLVIFSTFLFFLITPVTEASLFRRPLNTILSPMVSYYYDDNASSSIAQRYNCSTSNVYNNHRGTDFPAVVTTPIYAARSGALYYRIDGCPTVGYLGSTCGGGFGNHVRIDHEGPADGVGWVTIYAHMKAGTPAWYQSLLCSTYVGQSGSSGSSTNPHLHFEVRKYAYPNNDPFPGACGGTSFWTSLSSTGIPGTTCSG